MANPTELIAHLKTIIENAAGVHVYYGHVPGKLPETGGYIDPYVLLLAGTGAPPGEVTTDGAQAADVNVFDFQTTAVGPTPDAATSLASVVGAALMNTRAGTGRIRPNPQGFTIDRTLPDTTVIPSRHMLPAQWRLITN